MQNFTVDIAKSAQRTAGYDVAFDNTDCTGLFLVIDCTAVSGGAITVTVQGVDVASGKKFPLLASASITGVGTTVLRVGRSLTAAANLVVNDQLPKKLNVNVNHTNASPITYSIGASLCL